MALNRPAASANASMFSRFGQGCRNDGMKHRFMVEMLGKNGRVCFSNDLVLRSCLDRSFRRGDDDVHRAWTVAPNRRWVGGSGIIFREDLGMKFVIGDEICNNSKSILFSEQFKPEKLVVAVDVDEVLGSFLAALNKFIADRYASSHSYSEYHVYEFFRIWNCSRDEADLRVHEFFETSYFKMGIQPIPGAVHALHRLSKFCNLSVVTSRQNVIKDITLEWIENHYSGLFQEIHFGNHFALDGQSKPKSEICRSLGAHVLIDDNPRYALECAEIGMRVLLFDYYNSYPWSKTGVADSHPLVTRVHNWQEVEDQLVSLIS